MIFIIWSISPVGIGIDGIFFFLLFSLNKVPENQI